jgi:hypothetical protein
LAPFLLPKNFKICPFKSEIYQFLFQIKFRSAMVTEPSPPLHINWANWQAGSAIPTATNTSSNKMPKQQAAEICKTIVLQAVEGSPLLKMHSEERLKPIFKQAMQKYLENKGNM